MATEEELAKLRECIESLQTSVGGDLRRKVAAMAFDLLEKVEPVPVDQSVAALLALLREVTRRGVRHNEQTCVYGGFRGLECACNLWEIEAQILATLDELGGNDAAKTDRN